MLPLQLKLHRNHSIINDNGLHQNPSIPLALDSNLENPNRARKSESGAAEASCSLIEICKNTCCLGNIHNHHHNIATSYKKWKNAWHKLLALPKRQLQLFHSPTTTQLVKSPNIQPLVGSIATCNGLVILPTDLSCCQHPRSMDCYLIAIAPPSRTGILPKMDYTT